MTAAQQGGLGHPGRRTARRARSSWSVGSTAPAGRRSVVGVRRLAPWSCSPSLYFGVVNTPGWAAVQQSFFDPEVALDTFPDDPAGPLAEHPDPVLRGDRRRRLRARCSRSSAACAARCSSRCGCSRPATRTCSAGCRSSSCSTWSASASRRSASSRGSPPEVWGTIAIILTYSAYVAEVLRAGMEAVHPSQRLAARSLGLSHAQTLRLVVLPQGVRKVTPALMNDFVSMQKDVGLVSVLGAVDAVRAAQIAQADTYNFTPYFVAGLLFVVISLPLIRLTDAIARRAAAARADRRHRMSEADLEARGASGTDGAVLELRGLRKAFGEHEVLRGIDLTVDQPPGHLRHRRLAAPASRRCSRRSTCSSGIDDGRDPAAGRRTSADPRIDVDAVRARIGVVFQQFNLFPHMSVLDNVTLASRQVHGIGRAEAEATARRLLDRIGLADVRRCLPRPAVRRPAAARRDRPGDRVGPGTAAARRGHERARPAARRRGARPGHRAEASRVRRS